MALHSKKPSNKNRFLKKKHSGKPVGISLVKRDITKRKRVEEALRESEEKYRSLVDGANEAILVVQDGLVKFVNLRAVEVAGYSGPDIMDKPFPDFIYPDDRAMVMDNYAKRMKGEPAPSRYEFRLLSIDGSATWVEINTVQIDWDGKPASLIFLTDISERKQAEQKLQESEEKYRSLVDGADEGILVAQDGILKFVNHRMAEFSGYSEPELLAKPFPEFIHPDDRQMVMDYYVKRMKGVSAPSRYEFRMLTADGGAKWVEITIAGIEWHGRPAVLSFLADITERKQAEHKLRESEEKFSKIFKTSPDSVTITRLTDGMYLEINQNFTDTTGFTPEEVLGRSSLPGGVALWTKAEDRDRMVAGLRAHGEVIGMEAPLRMKNGAIRTALLSARILEINGEKCILTIARDITERKLAEEALRESEEKYRSLVDGANEAILVAQDGMLKFVNHKAAELSGHPEPVLLAKPFPEFIHPDDRAMVVNNYVKRMKGEPVPSRYEFRLLTLDGSAKWVDINTVLMDWKGKPATLNFLTDITERKQAEEGRRFLLKTASDFLELAPDQNIYLFIAEKLRELAGDLIIVVTSFDESSQNFRTEALVGLGNLAEKILKILGKDPVGMSFPIHERSRGFLTTGNLEKVEESFYELTFHQIPAPVCKTFENLYGYESSYSMGFTWKGKLFGAITILGRKGTEVQAKDIIETFIRQASQTLQRKMAEEELKFRNLILSTQQEVSIDGILVVGETGKIVSFNQRFIDMWAIPPDVMESKSDDRVLQSVLDKVSNPEEFIKRVKHLYSQQRETSRDEISLKDGRTLDRYSAPMFGSNGKYHGRVWYFRDITDRKNAIRVLEMQARMLDSATDSIVLHDKDGAIKYVNEAASRHFGHSLVDLMSMNLADLNTPESAKSMGPRLKAVIEKGKDMYEAEHLRKDGSVRPVEVNSRIFAKGDEKLILSVVRDITDRKNAEKEKEKLQSELLQVQKMEAVGTLAGGVAHDFNNILTAISGYATLAMGRIDESNPVYRDLKQMSLAAAKAAGVVRQLLLFSRKEHMEQVPMDPNATIIRMLKMLDRIIGEDIVIETKLEKELWSILGDEGNIEQVLMNLAVNAKDAMPRGGKLSIKTENVTIDQEFCRTNNAARPGRFVCLSISDTGTGMDELTQEHIFEPFFTTKEVGKGTGLGLSVVLGILQQHRGWINVYSELGRGTTFKVYFPSTSGRPEQQSNKEAPLGSLRGKGERIMVVEDHTEVREIAKEMLETNGYSVFPVSTAKEAMELFEKENGNFDLVFSDVILTDMAGTLMVEDLLKRWKFGVIISSGYTDEKAKWDLINEKKYRFLPKPYAMQALLQAVKDVLEENKS